MFGRQAWNQELVRPDGAVCQVICSWITFEKLYDLSMCKAAILTPILLHAQHTHTILMCHSPPRTVRIPHLIQHSCDTFHQAIFSGSACWPQLQGVPATPACFCCGWYSAPAHTPLTQLGRRERRPSLLPENGSLRSSTRAGSLQIGGFQPLKMNWPIHPWIKETA